MDAIVLAAGSSRRFHGNKLLHLINGQEMYKYSLNIACDLQKLARINRVILVTQYEVIRDAVMHNMPTVNVVMNDKPEEGISYSIVLGLEALLSLNSLSESCVFMVSDQPNLQSETVEGFLQAYQDAEQRIGVCACGNRMGNPVIFSKKYYPELLQMQGDKGGKQVAMQHKEDIFLHQVPEYQLEDMDVRIITT